MLEAEQNDIGLWKRRSGEDWRMPVMRREEEEWQRRTAANRKTHTETEKH